jgi:F-box and WD-40 domain protein 1/11
MPHRPENDSQVPIPGLGDEPPVIPRNTGAAAKAAAAMQNEFFARQGLHNRWLHTPSSEDGNDRESGIGISVTVPDAGTDAADEDVAGDAFISRIDFVTKLPSELAISVLAYLDAAALAKAVTVSHGWNKIASNQHIWRESCLREMGTTFATSGPVKANSGLGVPKVLPSSDWKQIYRAKQELERRWKAGKAQPVYLNGHSDSIYCLQFDE